MVMGHYTWKRVPGRGHYPDFAVRTFVLVTEYLALVGRMLWTDGWTAVGQIKAGGDQE